MVPPTVRYLLLAGFCCTPILLLFVLICCCDDSYPAEMKQPNPVQAKPLPQKNAAMSQTTPTKKSTEKTD